MDYESNHMVMAGEGNMHTARAENAGHGAVQERACLTAEDVACLHARMVESIRDMQARA
jgi:hypothetical protein